VIHTGFSDSKVEAIIVLRVQSQMLRMAGYWCDVSRKGVHISLACWAPKHDFMLRFCGNWP